jgi:CubicO group peptidase (beta-lactamase class C family)
MKNALLIFFILLSPWLHAQLYFPPLGGNTWETVSPAQLNWCTDRTDSLYQLLESKNTKAFIILKDGKIVVEKYFGTFTVDSSWYWASSAKSLTAFIAGIAQQQGLFSTNDSVSKYLGAGWTSCPPDKEGLITIKHQLTMTTGLDYTVPDLDCSTPACLQYKSDAGTAWYYHNAPYHLVHDVIAAASGKTYQQFTTQQLSIKTGITGAWIDHVFYSKPRSMARFGLLMLNKGVWNADTILADTEYYHNMINTSQPFNNAYGYLWWLNGKSSFKIPGSVITIPGKLCPPAPDDVYMALGKNDQKLYVWPSRNIVVVRMGNEADGGSLVPITFDTLLWKELNRFMCSEYTGVKEVTETNYLTVWPNPANTKVKFILKKQQNSVRVSLYNYEGKEVYQEIIEPALPQNQIDISSLRSGIYTLRIVSGNEVLVKKLMVHNE